MYMYIYIYIYIYIHTHTHIVVNLPCKIKNVSRQPLFQWYSKCEVCFVGGEIWFLGLYYILVLIKVDKSYAMWSVTV